MGPNCRVQNIHMSATVCSYVECLSGKSDMLEGSKKNNQPETIAEIPECWPNEADLSQGYELVGKMASERVHIWRAGLTSKFTLNKAPGFKPQHCSKLEPRGTREHYNSTLTTQVFSRSKIIYWAHLRFLCGKYYAPCICGWAEPSTPGGNIITVVSCARNPRGIIICSWWPELRYVGRKILSTWGVVRRNYWGRIICFRWAELRVVDGKILPCGDLWFARIEQRRIHNIIGLVGHAEAMSWNSTFPEFLVRLSHTLLDAPYY